MKIALGLGATACVVLLVACSGDTDTQSSSSSGTGGSTSSGTGGSSSSSGTGGSSTSSGTGGSSTSSGTGGSSTSSGMGGGGGGCPANCESDGFTCCGNQCVNPHNDIHNCGGCGKPCPGDNPFCDNGTCGTPPCNGGTCTGQDQCCGTACCSPGQLCCVVPGPVVGPPVCQAPNDHGTCDMGCLTCVCAAPDTPIATPAGEVPIAALRAGDHVYSVDGGRVKVVSLLRVGRTAAHHHHVMHLVLADGRELHVSPGHPTVDGRTLGELHAGDRLGGVPIVSTVREPYRHAYTYDILPDSDTASYFAAGALIGSTMATLRAPVPAASFTPSH